MKAYQRDRIVLAASRFDAPTKNGEVLEIDGQNGEPPYLVRWADGRLCPEPDLVLEDDAEDGQSALAEVILLSDARTRRAQRA